MNKTVSLNPATFTDPGTGIISGAALVDTPRPPVCWIIPGILPAAGVHTIVAPPKCGKSLLFLNALADAALGRPIWGRIPIREAIDTLYCTFPIENGSGQTRTSLLGICGDDPIPENLYFSFDTPHYDYEYIREKLEYFNVQCLVIDTWGTFLLGRKSGRDIVANDRAAIVEIRRLADEYGIGVLLVHHTSKPGKRGGSWTDLISGTNALFGSCDGGFYLERKDGETKSTLHTKGRDIQEKSYSFNYDVDTRRYTLDAWDHGLSEARQNVLTVLANSQNGLTSGKIAERLGKKQPAICNHLKGLKETGLVIRTGNHYRLSPEGIPITP